MRYHGFQRETKAGKRNGERAQMDGRTAQRHRGAGREPASERRGGLGQDHGAGGARAAAGAGGRRGRGPHAGGDVHPRGRVGHAGEAVEEAGRARRGGRRALPRADAAAGARVHHHAARLLRRFSAHPFRGGGRGSGLSRAGRRHCAAAAGRGAGRGAGGGLRGGRRGTAPAGLRPRAEGRARADRGAGEGIGGAARAGEMACGSLRLRAGAAGALGGRADPRREAGRRQSAHEPSAGARAAGLSAPLRRGHRKGSGHAGRAGGHRRLQRSRRHRHSGGLVRQLRELRRHSERRSDSPGRRAEGSPSRWTKGRWRRSSGCARAPRTR